MNLIEKTFGCIVLFSALILASGCAAVTAMTEPEEVTPEQIALEVIVTPGACSLNADEVGAAMHPVAVLTEHGTGRVRILNQADEVVFEATSTDLSEQETPVDDNQPQMRAADEGGQSEVRLVPGDYRVECSMGGSVSTASLHVIPPTRSASE
jgi:hypothetical protein